jgi:glycosyltransferase involved in cell wall biosynthesis
MPDETRDLDLIYLGRLDANKGIDALLNALAVLKQKNLTPNLTIVGEGPSRQALEKQVEQQGLKQTVRFTGRLGPMDGDQLPRLLNRHKIMVVPSRWNEPFGIVALEGIACGCAVIGSSGGGLPEAIGPCGEIFPNGDVVVLAEKIEMFLKQPDLLAGCRRDSASHLARHQPEVVAQKYIELLQSGFTA